MRTEKAIALYAVAVFALSAALAPWLFWVVHTFGDWPFRRVFNRVILVVALVGLWPLSRSVGIRSWRELGYEPVMFRQLLAGLAIGIASYAAGMLSLCFTGNLWKCAAIGMVVALIEETFFRGGLQNVFQRRMPAWLAVALVSVLYSVVHFLKPSGAHIPDVDVTWRSGFEYLGGVAASSFQEPGVWRRVVSLWLVGVVLGWAFVRTRTLYLSIGLHAGWVFAMKTLGGTLVDDPMIWPVLVVVLGGIEWWSRRKQTT
jgi:membrane protease YdiL (CAAX protease family)